MAADFAKYEGERSRAVTLISIHYLDVSSIWYRKYARAWATSETYYTVNNSALFKSKLQGGHQLPI